MTTHLQLCQFTQVRVELKLWIGHRCFLECIARYAEKRGYEIVVIDQTTGEEAGYKKCSF